MTQQPAPSLVEMARMRRALLAKQAQSGPAALPRVLFVDDEERILRALQALFRVRYDISITTSGAQALELLQQSHYHLIVSDQRMPQMQGIEVLRQARQISPNTVRILLTGFADLAAIVGSVNDGEVYRYLSKPWDNTQLAQTIDEAVHIGMELQQHSDSATPQQAPAAAAPSAPAPAPTPVEPAAPAPTPTPAPEPAAAETAPPPKAVAAPAAAALSGLPANACILFLEKNAQTWQQFSTEVGNISGVPSYNVASMEEAVDFMAQHRVAVMVVAVDGENQRNEHFLYLLKERHAHIVTVTISDYADSEQVIRLINSARVLRVIFRPASMGILQMYINTALRRAATFRKSPVHLRTEMADRAPIAAARQQQPNLGHKLLSIKNFLLGG